MPVFSLNYSLSDIKYVAFDNQLSKLYFLFQYTCIQYLVCSLRRSHVEPWRGQCSSMYFFFFWLPLREVMTSNMSDSAVSYTSLWCQWHSGDSGVRLSSVTDTVIQWHRAWSFNLRCQWHHWAWLCVVNHTAELDSAVSITPLSMTLRCQWHRWV